jgi:hypothetical protein
MARRAPYPRLFRHDRDVRARELPHDGVRDAAAHVVACRHEPAAAPYTVRTGGRSIGLGQDESHGAFVPMIPG